MARPTKSGIDYFPLDCEWDNKIEMYIAEKESTGLAVLVTLWQLIYKNSYFIEYNNDLLLLTKKRINVDINLINECINSAVQRGIFDRNLFESGILTSKAIQKRFFEAAKRKKVVQVSDEHLLIDVSAYNNLINVDINPINERINATKLNVNVKVNVKGKLNVKVNESEETNLQLSNFDLPLPLLTKSPEQNSSTEPEDYENIFQVTDSVKSLLAIHCNIEEPDKATLSSFVKMVTQTPQVKNRTAFKYLRDTLIEFKSLPEEKQNLKYVYSRAKGRINDVLIKRREELAQREKDQLKNNIETISKTADINIEQIANKIQIN